MTAPEALHLGEERRAPLGEHGPAEPLSLQPPGNAPGTVPAPTAP